LETYDKIKIQEKQELVDKLEKYMEMINLNKMGARDDKHETQVKNSI